MSPTQLKQQSATHNGPVDGTITIAIIGTGVIANRHLAVIAEHPKAALAGVCDINQDAGRKAAQQYGCRYHAYTEALWADPDIDAVYLCLPNFLHFEMAATAMRRGKHVFVEKPMANTVEQCNQLQEISRETGMGLVVGHQYRFLPASQRLKSWIENGELGQVMVVNDRIVADYRIETRSAWFQSKKTAGHGVFLNNGVHQIDRLCWLLDEAPVAISAQVDAGYPGRDIDSHVNAQWTMPRGVSVNLLTAGYPSGPENSIEVIGTTGQARLNYVTSTLTLHREMEPEQAHELPDKTHAAGKMIEQLHAFIHHQTPPQTGTEWGRFIVQTAWAHYESGERRKPVSAPPLPYSI